MEIVGEEVGAQPEVIDQPLRGVSSDRSGVTIRIAKPGGIHLEHLVVYPTDLRMAESEEGDVLEGLRFEVVDHHYPLPVIARFDEVSRRLLARFSPDGGHEPPPVLVFRPLGAYRR